MEKGKVGRAGDAQKYLRAGQIAGKNGILPISLSTWWDGVKSGRYPKPTKLGPRITVWSRDEVMALAGSGATVNYYPSLLQLQLTVRSLQAILSMGVTTSEQLCLVTETELKKQPTIGRLSIAEIKEKLSLFGLKLAA